MRDSFSEMGKSKGKGNSEPEPETQSEKSPFVFFEKPVDEKDYKILGCDQEIHPMVDVFNHWIPTIDYTVDPIISSPLDQEQTKPPPEFPPEPPASHGGGGGDSPVATPPPPPPPPKSTKPRQTRRSRKYKKHGKLMTREELIKNEKWNWRKYGQKSIQGSDFPRNYYRCSTSKACNAKMFLEIKNHGDPIIYEIHYSGEHNHARPIHRPLFFTRTKNFKKLKVKNSEKPVLPTLDQELSPQQEPEPEPEPEQVPFVPSNDSPILESRDNEEINVDDSEVFYYNNEEFKIELIPNAIVMEDTFMGLQELGIVNPSFMMA